ncbi:uncharacterized protein LOC107846295 [Capsicum annuum]|uniref:uncharacterized protein LOC107846295 n=1 Tax=Capsicum annuum TaxID=4072 RepID=UPI001FB15E95|nr:uncharacterized protein LOC107846295 [Capsicum annuum]
MNGVVEAANKNIKRILRKIVDDNREWHEKLPYALLGYHTTIRTFTGIGQLMLIDEKRLDAVCHGQLYQNRMIKVFNKKVKPRRFTTGQLVLKKIFPYQDKAKGKFEPNWQGPYIVHRVLSGGAVIFAEVDRTVSTKSINSDALKKYYI